MSWVTIIWSVTAFACLTLAAISLLVWCTCPEAGVRPIQSKPARFVHGNRRAGGIWLAAVIICLFVYETWAAKSTFRSDPDYLIDTWETEDGLPENSATAMVQTPDGYLWFGTFNGLVRFDGVKFTVYTPADTPDLPSAAIVNLHVDHRGRLWVSTDRGLVVREGDKGPVASGGWRSFGTNEGWAGDFVRTFAERANGDLLLTTFDGHVLEFVGGRLKALPPPPGQPGQGYSGVVDETGQWWVAQRDFVGRWDGQHWVQTFHSSQSLRDPAVFSLSARDGGVWVLFGKELLKFRRGAEVSRVTVPQMSGGIWSIYEDSGTNVWISSFDSGLFRLDPSGSLQHWTTTNGLANLSCRFVFEDQERNLWVGTSGGGLTRFKPRRFQDAGRTNLLLESLAKSVSPASDGGMWMADYDHGLFKHGAAGVSAVDRGPLREGLYGLAVLEDRAGRVWYGEKDGCWWRHGTASFEKVPLAWAKDADVKAFFEDSKGRIWISGGQAVALYDGNRFHEFGAASGLPSGGIACFGEDNAGVPWLAAGDGVFRYEKERFVEVRTAEAKPLRGITCFKAEPDGTMWMGTRTQGLLRLRDGRLSAIGPSAGFPVQAVQAIIQDGLGYFWMPSNRGIVRAARQELHAVADGAKARLDCLVLDQHDGLPSAECSSSQPSCAQDRSGRLWFATQKGVAMIDPAGFRLNSRPPPVHIEQFAYYASGKRSQGRSHQTSDTSGDAEVHLQAPFKEPLYLAPGSHRLEIGYAALNYSTPEKVRFQTMLEGIGHDWEDAANRRVARFYELEPGQYRFRVRAANNDGVWNETGASLAFSVQPFFWQTSGFKALVLGMFAAVVYGVFRRRENRLEKAREVQRAFTRQLLLSQENERKRIAAELHDGLGQDLLLIKNRVALATARQAEPAELKSQLEAATAATTRAVKEVRAISHALRPAALEHVGLTKAIEWMVEQLGEGSATKFAAEVDTIDGLLASEMEIHLFRIIQEGLNNIIRHAGAAQVILEVKREGGGIRVSLFDNGKGFDAEKLRKGTEARPGLGLASIEERVKYLGGNLDIQSAPGRGTRLTVRLPLPRMTA